MSKQRTITVGRFRLILVAIITAVFSLLLMNLQVHMKIAVIESSAPKANAIKVFDFKELIPEPQVINTSLLSDPEMPPLEAPLPSQRVSLIPLRDGVPDGGDTDLPYDTQELIAETVIETDETPLSAIIGGGRGGGRSRVPGGTGTGAGDIYYLPQNLITRLPQFPEDRIVRATVYPPVAQRSGIEGSVYLELFIDDHGKIRRISILEESPSNRGFGEAAVNAFKGISATPAEANGVPVAVRFKYTFNFSLR